MAIFNSYVKLPEGILYIPSRATLFRHRCGEVFSDRMGGFSWANAPGRRPSRGYLRAPGF